jgi:hypothetical protein
MDPAMIKCRRCKFWIIDIENKTVGECRRYPPVVGDASNMGLGISVYTKETHWCGEFGMTKKDQDEKLRATANMIANSPMGRSMSKELN